MYDDLARTQRPSPLEWFVVNAVIPTLVVTLALQVTAPRRASPPTIPADDDVAGCVVLEGAVGPLGLVDPRSIVVVSATHRRLVPAARQTILAHLRIIAVGWRPMPARVRVPFEFSVKE